jgi:hypothetical protein
MLRSYFLFTGGMLLETRGLTKACLQRNSLMYNRNKSYHLVEIEHDRTSNGHLTTKEATVL